MDFFDPTFELTLTCIGFRRQTNYESSPHDELRIGIGGRRSVTSRCRLHCIFVTVRREFWHYASFSICCWIGPARPIENVHRQRTPLKSAGSGKYPKKNWPLDAVSDFGSVLLRF